jgi:hypothetical protein
MDELRFSGNDYGFSFQENSWENLCSPHALPIEFQKITAPLERLKAKLGVPQGQTLSPVSYPKEIRDIQDVETGFLSILGAFDQLFEEALWQSDTELLATQTEKLQEQLGQLDEKAQALHLPQGQKNQVHKMRERVGCLLKPIEGWWQSQGIFESVTQPLYQSVQQIADRAFSHQRGFSSDVPEALFKALQGIGLLAEIIVDDDPEDPFYGSRLIQISSSITSATLPCKEWAYEINNNAREHVQVLQNLWKEATAEGNKEGPSAQQRIRMLFEANREIEDYITFVEKLTATLPDTIASLEKAKTKIDKLTSSNETEAKI